MQVVWTPVAEVDLEDIAYFIGIVDRSPATAKRVVQRIQDACKLRSTMPESAAVVPELGSDIRAFTVDSFVVVYRLFDDEFQILLVSRGARDIPSIFHRRYPR